MSFTYDGTEFDFEFDFVGDLVKREKQLHGFFLLITLFPNICRITLFCVVVILFFAPIYRLQIVAIYVNY